MGTACLVSTDLIVILVFCVGYLAIALEHSLKVNKTASALLMSVVIWSLFILTPAPDSLSGSDSYAKFLSGLQGMFTGDDSQELHRAFVVAELSHHLASISEILFFLLGAMTIVELIDAHHGFRTITDRITTRSPKVLLWTITWITFFLSAILDNLTTTIVMISLIRKLVPDEKPRLVFAGMIVIAANAGGAWTPIGDVTTTMLWIGGQITTVNTMKTIFLPSVVCILVPLLYFTFNMPEDIGGGKATGSSSSRISGGRRILLIGIGALISVPIFKTYTHLPPYMGMLAGVGVLWVVSEFLHPGLDEVAKRKYTVAGALSRVDVSSVLFFLGILLAVGALESMHILDQAADYLAQTIGDNRVIIALIGLLSAVVDNVPLVAASMGMYSTDMYPADHMIWTYLAYCAGTGGSILIIGSAAGVAAMGMEKIDFIWYLRKISLIALLGYLAGAAVYLVQ